MSTFYSSCECVMPAQAIPKGALSHKTDERQRRLSKSSREVNMDNDIMRCIADAIRSGNYAEAKRMLKLSVAEEMENPQVYNLLGVCYEREGDRVKAARFYRVAYYMNQSFKPAADNLERINSFWYKGTGGIDYGLNGREVK